MKTNISILFVFILLTSFICTIWGQPLHCTFYIDLSSPYIDVSSGGIYPPPGDTILSLDITFGAKIIDDGAGVWLNNSDALDNWNTICGKPIGTFITWAINDFSEDNFDTLWDSTFVVDSFDYGDSIKVCIHAIDKIKNYGLDCSCCPNELDTCWKFYVAPCDSYELLNLCPAPCGITTSKLDQSVYLYLWPAIGALGYRPPDTTNINVKVFVNGILTDSSTIGDVSWASYYGSTIDRVFPDEIIVEPPTGSWDHHDSVEIIVWSEQCPFILENSCWFLVDLKPPELTYYYPANRETLTVDNVNILGVWEDDFSGIKPEVTSMRVTIWDSLGSMKADFNVPGGYSDTIWFDLPLVSGDSVRVCSKAQDNVDIQYISILDLCTGEPNEAESCWVFYNLFTWPEASIIEPCDSNGDGKIITACSEQQIRILIYDVLGLDSIIVLRIGPNRYDYLELESTGRLEWHGRDTIIINFDSYSVVGFEWIHIRLDTVINLIGNNLLSPVIDSFLVDRAPPDIYAISPSPASTVYESVAVISLSARDRVCIEGIIDSVRYTGLINGFSEDFWFSSDSFPTITFTYELHGFTTGDSAILEIWAHDDCHDYCGPNILRFYTGFKVILANIRAEVLEPIDLSYDFRVISTCEDQRIIWKISHDNPLVFESIYVEVNDSSYDTTDAELVLSNDSLYFFPSTPWMDGDTVKFCLTEVTDTLDNELVEDACGSVIIDLSGPTFYNLDPGWGSIMPFSADIRASAYDSICGPTDIDSLRITQHYFDSLFRFPLLPIHVESLWSSDTFRICAYSSDSCMDYCESNISDTCWEFYTELIEISADVVEPIDENADGRIISTCDDQGAIWLVHADYSILPNTIVVEVDGITYTYPDPTLRFEHDTVFFNPHAGSWSNGDSIIYCLIDIRDIRGGSLISTVCTHAIIDLTPPEVNWSSISPPLGRIIDDSILVFASFTDSICDTDVDLLDSVSISIHRSSTVIDSIVATHLPLPARDLEDIDTVWVCAHLSDKCMDYCLPNRTKTCWSYEVQSAVVIGEFRSPPDTNFDGRRISTCSDQTFAAIVKDRHGMDTNYVHMTVNGIEYRVTDPEVELTYAGDSTALLIIFTPSTPWAGGEWIIVNIDSARNIWEVNLNSPIIDSFLIDLDPPEFAFIGPSGTHIGDSAIIAVSANDSICRSLVSLDSLVITSSLGRYENWGSIWDGMIEGLADSEVIVICAYAHDLCADTCDFNFSDSCWTFDVHLGEVAAEIIEPIDSNDDGRIVSSCDDQIIRWVVTPEFTLVWTTMIIEVDGVIYDTSSSEVSFSGDTVIFTPSALWTDGDSITFCLNTLCDITGGCLDSSVCSWMLIDLSPPVLTPVSHTSGDTISERSFTFSYEIKDSICDENFVITSIQVASDPTGVEFEVSPDSESVTISNFQPISEITIIIDYRDNCIDYCGPNATSDTITFTVQISDIYGFLLVPFDVNLDGCIQTHCPCQPIQWGIISMQGVDTLSISVVVDGITYGWGPYINLRSAMLPGDTIWILHFYPFTAGSCWFENGYNVHYSIDYMIDTLALDSIVSDVAGSFQMLLEPPEIILSPMPDDTAWCLDSIRYTFSISDDVACSSDGESAFHHIRDGDTLVTYTTSDGQVFFDNIIHSDSICMHALVYNWADFGVGCDSPGVMINSIDTCYFFWCPCILDVFAGTDKYSCPGTEVTLGCITSATGAFDSVMFNWYLEGEITPFYTSDNPVVTPETTTTYILEGAAICRGGDTLKIYDTITVHIDFEPPSSPTIINPVPASVIEPGVIRLIWNNSTGTPEIMYQVLLNGIIVSDSMIDTTYTLDIECEDTLDIAVVAFNRCEYSLDYSCYGDSIHYGTTPTVYETSAVVIYGEPCGGPLVRRIFPEHGIFSACTSQASNFALWDIDDVPLVPESLITTINEDSYRVNETFIEYTEITQDSSVIRVSPPYGVWEDNDTILITITQIFNIYEISLTTSDTAIFYTDFAPPIANFSYPIQGSLEENYSPEIRISLIDNHSGIDTGSVVIHINTSTSTIDTTLYLSDLLVNWHDSEITVDCSQMGLGFAEGETVTVNISSCDLVTNEFCGPNCETFSFWFYYSAVYHCLRMPNPITPNYDNINDFCQFIYPGMNDYPASIHIFDLTGREIREIDVPVSDNAAKYSTWDGLDNNGCSLPPGIYIYLIDSNGQIVCNGTVTIAR